MKANKTPLPICASFLTCREITKDAKTKEPILIGLPRSIHLTHYPGSRPIWVFTRLTSAHGSYNVEVQVQTPEGEITCKEGPPVPIEMDDPLKSYDVNIQMHAIYPRPGLYFFVLLINGEEVARQSFNAIQLDPKPA